MAEQSKSEAQPQPRRRGRLIRRLALALIGLVGLLVLLGFGAFAWVNSPPGRDWLVRFLEDELSTPGEQTVKIGGLDGALPSLVQVNRVSLADKDGVWLNLQAATLDWRPLELLEGKLTVRSLVATDLEVARLPGSPAEDSEAPTDMSLPELPFDISVEHLEIADVKLGEPVLGTAASFHVTGAAAAGAGDGLRSTLSVARTDGIEGSVEVAAIYWPDDDCLKLDARAAEPPGGLIARSLDLPDLPAVNLTLTGEGPVASWQGRLTASLGGLGSLDADLALAREPELALRAKGTAQGDALPSEFPWSLLEGQLAFELDATWSEDRQLTLNQVTLDNERVSVQADGSLDTAELTLDAKANVTMKDTAPLNAEFAPLSLQGLQASASAQGALLQPSVTLDLDASGLDAESLTAERAVTRLSVEPDGPLDAETTRVTFSADGTLEGVRVEPEETTAPLLGSRLTWTASGALDATFTALQLNLVALTWESVSVAGNGKADLQSGAITASLDGKLDDLSRLERAIGQALQGSATVHADIDAKDFGNSLHATLEGTLNAFRSGIPAADSLIGTTPRFGADIALDPVGRLAVSSAHVDGAEIWLTGEADIPADFSTISGSYAAGLERLASLSTELGATLEGQAGVEGEISGAIDNPRTSGVLTLRQLKLNELALGRVAVNYRAEQLASAPRGRLAASISAPAGAFEGSTEFALRDQRLALSNARITSEGTTVTGQAVVPLDGTPLEGEVTAEIASLAPWLDLAGLQGGGAAALRAKLSADGPRQAVEATGNFADLSYSLGEGDSLTAKEATLSLTTRDLAQPTSSEIALRAETIEAAGASLSELTLSAQGDAKGADFTLETRGELQGELALDASGRVTLEGATTTVNLASLSGKLLGRPLALRQPASLTVNGVDLTLTDLGLTFNGGEIDAAARLEESNVQTDLRVRNLPLNVVEIVVPDLSISGTLDGTAQIQGPRSNPTGSAQFTAHDMQLNDAPGLPKVETRIDATWRNGRLAVQGALSGFAREPATFTAEGPLQLAPDSLAVSMPTNEPISARMNWAGNLSQIWPLVPVDGHRLSGTANLNFAAAGTMGDPRLSGQFTVADGQYENLEQGTQLKNLAVDLELDGANARLAPLTANDGESGKLSAEGTAEIVPERGFPFELRSNFQDFTLLRRDDVIAVQDGTLTLDGTMESVALSGSLVGKRIEIKLGNQLPPSVIDLQVVEVNRAAVGLPERTKAEAASYGPNIKLDLTVDLPGRVFVRGLGLDSEWGGNLTVKGTAAQPLVDGELHVIRGQMSFIGRPFVLDKGNITFTGDKEINPILDIAAVSNRGDISVTALITGTANDPKFELSSVPPLPQDEILSRALFGKTTSELSAFEAAQLAQAVAELSGKGGGSGVLDYTRNLLGVDVLRVESDESGGPAVAAGRYLTDDVYVGVKQGAAAGSGSVGVEVELTPNISLKSDVGQTGESDIGVNFKWDY